MSNLPKINLPIYDSYLPSTEEKIKIRPFTVKEEKILLLALASNDDNQIELGLRQVINNCIVYPDNIDVLKLTTYDIEYLFVQLRARAVGETITLEFEPIKDSICSSCAKIRPVELDLLEIKVEKNPNHKQKVELSPTLGLLMKDPSCALLNDINKIRQSQNIEDILKLMAKCVDKIFDQEKTYDSKDYNVEEFVDFLESLPQKEFAKVDEFFATIPILKYTVNLDCPECGNHQEYVMEGYKDFLV